MTGLNDIIHSFSAEESLQFIQYLQKRNKRNDTKNIQLFQLLKDENFNLNDISIKIYKKVNKPALYALRKRLYRSVIEFSAKKALEEENSIDMQVAKYLLASRRFIEYANPKTAFQILDKAKTLAQENHLYSLLTEIYHTKIQYAHLNDAVDLNELIDAFNKNQKLSQIEEQLNTAYAEIRLALKKAERHGEVIDFEQLVKRIFDDYNINRDHVLTYKSFYQLATIISVSAFASKDYYKIESFLLPTYHKLSAKVTESKHLLYQIQSLYIIANTLFRNKKFKLAHDYISSMDELMKAHQKIYYKKFILKYNLLLGLIKNYSGEQEEAIRIFENSINEPYVEISTQLDLRLSLIMCYFQKGELTKAKRLLSDFRHTDAWYIQHNGIEWTIKKNLIEILLYLEIGELNLFESRLLSFKRNHYEYLKLINQKRVITYLTFVEAYYKNPNDVISKQFHDEVESSFSWNTYEDIFVMSFYAWLKSKMEKRYLYETTLELVEKTGD